MDDFNTQLSDLCNDKAERALIGSIFIKPKLVYECSLTPKHFTTEERRQLFRTLQEMMDKNIQPDGVTVAEYLEDSGDLGEIVTSSDIAEYVNSTPSTDNFPNYENMVIESYRKRNLYSIYLDGISSLNERKSYKVAEGIMDDSLDIIKSLNSSVKRINEETADFIEKLTEMQEYGLPEDHISTGHSGIDVAVGGISPNDFTLISGPPGSGKTSYALQIVDNIVSDLSEDNKVLWLTWEMLGQEIYKRLVARRTLVSMSDMTHGKITTEQAKLIKDAVEEIHHLPLYIGEMDGGSVLDTKAEIRRLDSKMDVDLVVLDYLRLMDNHLDDGDKFDKLEDITKQLKSFTNATEIPVIGIMSLNREGTIWGNSQAEHDCNNHIAIVPQLEEDEDGVKRDNGDRIIAVRKARDGQEGVFEGLFHGEHATLDINRKSI